MLKDFIRNFSIIAHVDHGKSTLADRFFELTKKSKVPFPQFLDQMELEREKGITIKLAPLRMSYKKGKKEYILNLIDTPGHIDFLSEVKRSLKAVEGAILLVDATKGIQAQTLHYLELAKNLNLVIIPVVNKIDIPWANVSETKKEISKILPCPESEILTISAKYGKNIDLVLEKIIEKIPPPKGKNSDQTKIYFFDALYDPFKGVIAFVKIENGILKASKNREIGIFLPERTPVKKLEAGEIGYLIIRTKNLKDFYEKIGYELPQPMVFSSIFGNFQELEKALKELKLQDPSLYFKAIFSKALGRGFNCGFLGQLHMEVILERLKREYKLENLIITAPQVNYKKENSDYFEPEIELKIITPQKYLSQICDFFKKICSKLKNIKMLSQEKLILIYNLSLRELLTKNIYDKIQSISSGFASLSYKIVGFKKVKLVKLDILINKVKQEALSQLIPEKEAEKTGRKIISILKEILPPQQFALPLQAAIGGKIIARETIKAKRRDVLSPLYGGDVTRKLKLLERQKRGKKKLAQRTQLKIPPSVFIKLFQRL